MNSKTTNKKSKQISSYDELDQFDFSDGEYLEKVVEEYKQSIGSFLINFSILEQDLNLAIAGFIHDDSHDLGFVIIEKLSTSNKIELFYKMYVRLESFKDKNNIKILKEIKEKLKTINTFRNNIVHANWQSLDKDGFVRTKIIVDNQEGYVKFKKIKITPKIIRLRIKDIDKLIDQIDKYTEVAFQF